MDGGDDPHRDEYVRPRLGRAQDVYKRQVWDSGKVPSGSMHADYPNALASRQRVSWRVRLWDENDDPGAWSSEAFFEMGLLNASDWSALGVAGDYPVRKKQRYPVDCFRKVFSAGQVQKARLYLTEAIHRVALLFTDGIVQMCIRDSLHAKVGLPLVHLLVGDGIDQRQVGDLHVNLCRLFGGLDAVSYTHLP